MLKKFVALAFVTVASPTLAQGLPHAQDEWFVDSGHRQIDEAPSYNQAPTYQVVAYKETKHDRGLTEGRSGSTMGTIYDAPEEYLSTGRARMVSATGA